MGGRSLTNCAKGEATCGAGHVVSDSYRYVCGLRIAVQLPRNSIVQDNMIVPVRVLDARDLRAGPVTQYYKMHCPQWSICLSLRPDVLVIPLPLTVYRIAGLCPQGPIPCCGGPAWRAKQGKLTSSIPRFPRPALSGVLCMALLSMPALQADSLHCASRGLPPAAFWVRHLRECVARCHMGQSSL